MILGNDYYLPAGRLVDFRESPEKNRQVTGRVIVIESILQSRSLN